MRVFRATLSLEWVAAKGHGILICWRLFNVNRMNGVLKNERAGRGLSDVVVVGG